MKTISALTVILISLNATAASDAPAAAKDWTEKRVHQVEQIFVQPTPNKEEVQNPKAVKLVSPTFSAKVDSSSVQLTWEPSETAKQYHIQVSKDAGFNNRAMMIVDVKNVTDLSYEVANLEPKTKYFWRVAAVNGDQLPTHTKSPFTFSSFSTK